MFKHLSSAFNAPQNLKSLRPALSLLAALMLTLPAGAQDTEDRVFIDKSKIPAEGSAAKDFVPAGWQIESQLGADLNADGRGDIVLKLIQPMPAKVSEDEFVNRHRALVLLLKTPQGKFKRAAVADRLLQCTGCGGAFYGVMPAPADLTVEKGVLILRQDHGSRNVSSQTFRFRYDARTQKFPLIGFDRVDYDRLTGVTLEESSNFLTGAKIVTTIQPNEKTGKETKKVTKLKIPKTALSIEQIDFYKSY